VIFSGRPDPHWEIQANAPKMAQIKVLLLLAKKTKTFYKRDDIPARLGYKGFLVTFEGEERLILGPKTLALQQLLFETMPGGSIPNKIVARTLQTIKAGTVLPAEEVLVQQQQVRRKRYAPPFDIAPWMGAAVKTNNNCYNYANIRITNTFAQPGRGSTGIYAAITAAAVRAASVADGLVVVANGNFPAGARHVVALVVEDGKCKPHFVLRNSKIFSHASVINF